jgi:PAS domain S-box-containing protein
MTERKRAERTLRESEERFRLAAQVGKMFAYEWDVATDVVVRSGESVQILGIDEATPTTGQELMAKVHPGDRDRVTAAIAELNPEKSHLQISYRRVRPDGTVIWVERIGRAHFDEQGRMVRMVGMTADITDRKLAESELVLAHDRLRMAMEAGKSMGWDRDVKSGRDILFGDLQSVFGIPSEVFDARVEDFHRRVHPADRGRVLELIDDAMQTQKPYAAEFRILSPDGTARWVAARGKFYYSPDGEPERMLGIAVDITERKLVEEALRESEERLRLAAQAGKMYAFDWDVATDVIVRSAESTHILGSTTEPIRLIKQQLLASVHPDDRATFIASNTERTPESPNTQISFRFLRPDGSVLWLEKTGQAFFDEQGRIVRMIGMIADITERKLAEEALRESEERLRLAVQLGKIYAFEWDVATDVVIRSEEGSHILGLTGKPIRLTHQQILARVHPEDQATFIASIAELTPERPNTQISYRFLRPDGSVLWLERTGHAFFDEQGRMVRMVGMVMDVTGHKLAEEALASVSGKLIEAHEEERTRIARELHDDIGQRLALLVNDLEMMGQDPPDSAAEVRNRIYEHLRRVDEIATDVQAISHRLHSSKLRYLGIVVAAKSFCNELSEQHKVEIDFTHIDIPPSVPEEVSLCLFRVLQEALHNAVKHSRVRHLEVELRGASDGIHLSVRDSGVGFDPEVAINNRGLGLVSMQERVNLVKGTFSIDSKPKRGTTIHVRVPFSSRGLSAPAAGE